MEPLREALSIAVAFTLLSVLCAVETSCTDTPGCSAKGTFQCGASSCQLGTEVCTVQPISATDTEYNCDGGFGLPSCVNCSDLSDIAPCTCTGDAMTGGTFVHCPMSHP